MSTFAATGESWTGNGGGNGQALAQGLGWLSIALGAFEVLAPGTLARCLGVEHKEGLIRACGVREILNGAAILSAEDPAPWVWARVGGDALDLAALAGCLQDNPQRKNVEWTLATVAAVTALDVYCGRALNAGGESRALGPGNGGFEYRGDERPRPGAVGTDAGGWTADTPSSMPAM
jgi:hypothetical protein